jgi:hypothetical protein
MANSNVAVAEKSFYEEGTTKKNTGILSWILSTDHKRIGIMYLVQFSVF